MILRSRLFSFTNECSTVRTWNRDEWQGTILRNWHHLVVRASQSALLWCMSSPPPRRASRSASTFIVWQLSVWHRQGLPRSCTVSVCLSVCLSVWPVAFCVGVRICLSGLPACLPACLSGRCRSPIKTINHCAFKVLRFVWNLRSS